MFSICVLRIVITLISLYMYENCIASMTKVQVISIKVFIYIYCILWLNNESVLKMIDDNIPLCYIYHSRHLYVFKLLVYL